MNTIQPLLPTELSLAPDRLSPDDLQNAFIHFATVVKEKTGMDREWSPNDIVKVAEGIAKRFANRFGADGRIKITAEEFKRVLKEVIGEVFPAHVAMLMQALIEKGEADFNYESKGEAGEVEIKVIKVEEAPGEVEDSAEPDTSLELDLRTASHLLRKIQSPGKRKSYGT